MTKKNILKQKESKQALPNPTKGQFGATGPDASTQNVYDQVLYPSYPYACSQPERLYTIGKLFGMQPVDFAKCNVLELGCGSGGNLIPVASLYPDSTFVGIDLSEAQIKVGQEQVKKLGLKNILLKAISIADVTEETGKFDYIIVHGVLSWVSKEIQDKIFEICSKNLTKNGIAYVSYSTLPGGNFIKSLREMMLYHTQGFEKFEDKVREATLLLKFIQESNNQNSYSTFVNEEIENIRQRGDAYLIHEYLSEYNEPFYFHQVVEKAVKNGLQYVGDSAIATMDIANFPVETAKVLATAVGDIAKVEQYMDFIRNRRFRTSLFCNQEVAINRAVTPESIKDFYVTLQVPVNENLQAVDLTKKDEITVNFANGVSVSTANQSVILVLRILQGQRGKPVAVKALLTKVDDAAGKNTETKNIQQAVLSHLLRLVFADVIALGSTSGKFITEVTEKPKVSDLARAQALQSDWITNQRVEKASIDLFNRVLIQYLDGNNDFDAILDNMVKHVENDELALNVEGKKLSDKQQIREVLAEATKRNIENMGPLALLVA